MKPQPSIWAVCEQLKGPIGMSAESSAQLPTLCKSLAFSFSTCAGLRLALTMCNLSGTLSHLQVPVRYKGSGPAGLGTSRWDAVLPSTQILQPEYNELKGASNRLADQLSSPSAELPALTTALQTMLVMSTVFSSDGTHPMEFAIAISTGLARGGTVVIISIILTLKARPMNTAERHRRSGQRFSPPHTKQQEGSVRKRGF